MKIPFIVPSATVFLLGLQVASAQITYTVYCTREGLVGGTCANGHVIVANDHFCALPSRSVLNSQGGTTYNVTIKNTANGAVQNNVPIWDVGPWNTNDTYWASQRTYFSDLARGMPEAQAAYSSGYNGGKDQKGRTVLNRSGIDLADGTFYDLGSPSTVQVTFNWLTGTTLDNTSATYVGSWSSGTMSTDKYGADYRYHSTAAVSELATYTGTLTAGNHYNVYAWWTQGSNRSTTTPYTISIVGGTRTVNANQQANGGKWNLLASDLNIAGGANTVKVSCWTTTGFIVVADAVNWR